MNFKYDEPFFRGKAKYDNLFARYIVYMMTIICITKHSANPSFLFLFPLFVKVIHFIHCNLCDSTHCCCRHSDLTVIPCHILQVKCRHFKQIKDPNVWKNKKMRRMQG